MIEQRFEIPITPEQRREMFVGKSAPEAVSLLIASMPEIKVVTVISYKRGVHWETYPGMQEQLVLGFASENHFARETVLSANFWKEQAEALKKIEIPKDSPMTPEDVASWYDDEDEEESEGIYLSISSKFVVAGGYGKQVVRQIPFMDFTCLPSEGNLNAVKDSLKESGENKGIILLSGKSYHYYGLRSLSNSEWTHWMENWLRNRWLTPIADRRFIERSLEDGYNFLRLTSGLSKPDIPVVVDVI